MHKQGRRVSGPAALAVMFLFAVWVAAVAVPVDASSLGYTQTNLVTDNQTTLAARGFSPAAHVDANLVNPWGIAMTSVSPFWVANNANGKSTLYNGTGTAQSLVVTVPAAATGLVFNGTSDFKMDSTHQALFLFAAEDGTVAGWNPAVSPTTAVTLVSAGTNSVFKGLAIDNNAGNNELLVTDFRSGVVRVFSTNFAPVALIGGFIDPTMPAGFAPFGIRNIGGLIYVTYAKQDANKFDDVAGAGNGYVDVYNADGTLVKRLASQGSLNSPWGLALAPANFGDLSNMLLVGNFGDGRINAVDPVLGGIVGHANDGLGKPIVVEGLWGLTFGNGGNGGDLSKLYFAAGINGEQDGLFGVLAAKSPAASTSPSPIPGASQSPSGAAGANGSANSPSLPKAGRSRGATNKPLLGWLVAVVIFGIAPLWYRLSARRRHRP